MGDLTIKTPQPQYFECGQCGHFHRIDLPDSVDCRDDAHRFTAAQLDNLHGENQWDYIPETDEAE